MTAIRKKIDEEAYDDMSRFEGGNVIVSRGRLKSNEQLVEESVASFKRKLDEIISGRKLAGQIHSDT